MARYSIFVLKLLLTPTTYSSRAHVQLVLLNLVIFTKGMIQWRAY